MKGAAFAAVAIAILSTAGLGVCPAVAQGFVDAAGLKAAGGFGAGIGAAAGAKKAKDMNSGTFGALTSKLNGVAGAAAKKTTGTASLGSAKPNNAGNKYQTALNMEKAGKLSDAAANFAGFAKERQQLYGIGDNQVLKSYDRAADLASRAGNKTDAERYMRSALSVCQRASGINSEQVKQRMAKLGEAPPAAKSAPPASASSLENKP